MTAIPLALAGALAGLTACLRPPEYPPEPVVTFIGLSRDTIRQGFNDEDSLTLVIEFTDGDGDITTRGGDSTVGVFLRNVRTDQAVTSFALDEIDQNGLENGISGEIRMRVYTTCCDYPPEVGEFPCTPSRRYPIDRLDLEVYMVDRAGHESNRAPVAPIYLRCDTF